MKKVTYLSFVLLMAWSFTACDDNNAGEEGTGYDVPATYNFENVNYTGQTQRLDMLEELTAYMKRANNGEVLDAQVMLNMFANENDPFASQELNQADSKELENKTVEAEISKFQGFINDFAAATAESNGAVGSEGTAGVVTSTNDPSKKYFFDANGREHIQFIEKGLMGATFYYQATSIYLGSSKMDVDNEQIEEGQGTAMEHHWDEAFGYLGVAKDFPANTDGARFWGKYCNGRDAYLGTNEALMNAFIKGRAAISNKDLETRDAQIEIIRAEWEKVSAATAVHYLNDANANFADDAVRNHVLSEAWAFINSLKYNTSKTLTNSQIDAILALLGDNFYAVTQDNINAAKAELVAAFEFESVQDQL